MQHVSGAAAISHRTAETSASPGEAKAPPRRTWFAALRGTFALWKERGRFRAELERRARDDPYLIDDMGLTEKQVRAEIVKPFWQA